MNMSLEQDIKNQYCKFFRESDFAEFKKLADFYFESAAHLKKDAIQTSIEPKLLIRNIQKRLYVGIGIELLLKAIYLKNGYGINTEPVQGRQDKYEPYKINTSNEDNYNKYSTCTLNLLIQNITNGNVLEVNLPQDIIRGLLIAKVFRNKEGHIVTREHIFDPENYTDIENTIIYLYENYFNQKLDFQISMESNEVSKFNIN